MIVTIYCYILIATFYIRSGCGKAPEKISGGSSVEIEQFPFLVTIQDSINHNCGGCFIDFTHILTAAHCVVDENNRLFTNLRIHSGTKDTEERTYLHEVAIVITNPNYDPSISICEHDIAVLKLRKKFNPSSIRQPFPYITKDQPPAGSIALFAGWGLLGEESPRPSRYLQKIELRILSNQECESMLDHTVPIGTICTTNIENGNIHQGDSGGGLIHNGRIIGIASLRFRYVSLQIFVQVFAHRSWIRETVRKH